MKILFVINPGSGRKKDVDWKAIIEKYFEHLSHAIDFFIVEGDNASKELKKVINKSKPQRVIAVGGDGTVAMVAKELLHSDMQMGIIPAGSANGMARELEIPDEPEKALEIILEGEVKSADVILMNEKDICLHLSDIGLNAQLIKYFKEGSLRGKLGYARVVLKVLLRKQRMRVVIQSKEAEVLRSAVMVAIANASKFGTGATINPQGDIYDGIFEVVIVRKLGVLEILKMFLKFQRFNPKKIEVLPATSVKIETSHYVHFQIDGEYFGKVKSVTAKILPAQLNLLLPTNEKENKNP